MNRCPITYEPINSGMYSTTGLRRLNPALTELLPLPYDWQEQLREARERMTKISIAGVQPKVSARLSIKNKMFELVDRHGSFILKPQIPEFPEVPQNEDVTMKMADAFGIRVPLHGMIYAKDGSLVYFIRRFDRVGNAGKVHMEDLAQVSGQRRETKYHYSMEKVASLLETYCTFPLLEKARLFRLTLFSWIVGNEDMHLKNFSIIHNQPVIELSPAYDLLNSTIILLRPKEELALTLKGKKSKITRNILFDYFGKERLGLNTRVLSEMEDSLHRAVPEWLNLLDHSFLSADLKQRYLSLLSERLNRLGIQI